MRKRRLPVGPTIIAAYRDLARLLAAMPGLMLSAFVIMLASAAVAELMPQRLWDQQLSSEALGLAQNAVEALLLTPVVIAIHRFVILDKITRNYTLPIGEGVFGVFFGWLFALKVLIGLPMDILGLLETLSRSIWTILVGFAAATSAAAALVLRLLILLPALAVGAPGATASRALADSKGHVLRILAVLVLALVPWFAVGIGGAMVLGRGAMITGSPLAMLFLAMSGVVETIKLALTAVIASYAFMALADARYFKSGQESG
jgi:hypothetical protein